MSIKKPNIRKHLDSQPKISYPISRNNPTKKDGTLIDSPMFQMAQAFIENMETKYKLMIGGAIYLLISGIVANIYGIYKLINLLF